MPLPPDIYDREYFLSDTCEGADEFNFDKGLSRIKRRQVEHLAPGPGVRVLDAGCGRGEVLLACARAGSTVAGIDYSEAAVEISKDTLAGVEGADLRQGDISKLPWPDASFDRVLSGDVIEHLDSADGEAMLREAFRVLRPGGWLVLHTAPNLLFLRFTWPIARWPLLAAGYGESVRRLESWVAASKRYHVNEQSLYGLRRSLRGAGFDSPRVWIDANIVRDGSHHTTAGLESSWMIKAGQRAASLRPVRLLAGNDLWAIAKR
jgi:ubiquinone/menaquinone biosynthesis C-methylase UbiE